VAGAPRSLGALPALAIALLAGIVLALTQRSDGPSRAELAQALMRAGDGAVPVRDLRSLSCDAYQSAGYACRWQQRIDGDWRERTGRVQIDAGAWSVDPGVSDGQQR
jgi:hypothetical protein